MLEIAIGLNLLISLAVLGLIILVLRRGSTGIDLAPLGVLRTEIDRSFERSERLLREEMGFVRGESNNSSKQMREELSSSLQQANESHGKQQLLFADSIEKRLDSIREGVERRLEGLRTAIDDRLKEIQAENKTSLDQMRQTVDEKLHGTLEKRLGESFQLVSERLEQVHRGLGEMQTLASGVGDLKRVLTNVKARGTFGEVQLGKLLEQVLVTGQFAKNVDVTGNGERVEFAIRLPGRAGDNRQVWLPIDAKFPIEDYQRLLEARERADADAEKAAGSKLESRIWQCAATIKEKYCHPPQTTDFGILFLPTEGLFADVISRNGLAEGVQRELHIVVAGPTTLWAIWLSSSGPARSGTASLTCEPNSPDT